MGWFGGRCLTSQWYSHNGDNVLYLNIHLHMIQPLVCDNFQNHKQSLTLWQLEVCTCRYSIYISQNYSRFLWQNVKLKCATDMCLFLRLAPYLKNFRYAYANVIFLCKWIITHRSVFSVVKLKQNLEIIGLK